MGSLLAQHWPNDERVEQVQHGLRVGVRRVIRLEDMNLALEASLYPGAPG